MNTEKKYILKDTYIVMITLYSCIYDFIPDKNSNEYPFDSASVFLITNKTKSGSRKRSKKHLIIEKKITS